MTGKLISFEGIDFCGKSLQARMLVERLLSENVDVKLFREPGSTPISEKIRGVLLDVAHHEMSKETELLLYAAARAQMVRQELTPLLEQGKVIVCDRFYDSTTAYQGFAREIDLDFVNRLNNFATHGIKPDLTILVDLEPKIALKRKRAVNQNLDRLENESMQFYHKVRNAYLTIAHSKSDKDRFVIIEGEQTINAIKIAIYSHVQHFLSK